MTKFLCLIVLLGCGLQMFAATKRLAVSTEVIALRPGEDAPVPLLVDGRAAVAEIAESIVGIDTTSTPEATFLVSIDRRSRQLWLTPSLLTSKGDYLVSFTLRDKSGDEHTAQIRAAIQDPTPIPRTGRTPVVLLNGYQAPCLLADHNSSGTFGLMESYLGYSSVPVLFFNNCAEGWELSIEALGKRLGEYLDSLRYIDGGRVPEVDVVAHSMGGLIVRSYLSGKSDVPGVFDPPATPRIRKFVMIGTPNYGASLGGVTLDIQAREMLPGSRFLWDLATWNQGHDDLRGVDALSIAGNAGNSYDSGLDDGLVALTSAAIPQSAVFPSVRTRVVPYCHTGVIALFCFAGARAIADVETNSHLTWRIVQSFLGGSGDWQTLGASPWQDPGMSTVVGMMFSYADSLGRYFDPASQIGADLQGGGGSPLSFTRGSDNSPAIYREIIPKGSYSFDLRVGQSSFTVPLDLSNEFGYTVLPLRFFPAITEVHSTPAGMPGLTVQSGADVTIGGVGFISPDVPTHVYADGQELTISSITNSEIMTFLPSRATGLSQLRVSNGYGFHTVNIMTAPPAGPVLSLSTNSLDFTGAAGSTQLPSQTVSVLNAGSGTFLWNATTNASWLTLTAETGLLTVTPRPSTLTPGSYSGTIQVNGQGVPNSPQTIQVSLTLSPSQTNLDPLITSVVNGATFQAGIQGNSWVTIRGSNLAQTTRTWGEGDFDGNLPTSLDGVSVTVNGEPAAVYYISPTQINILAPTDAAVGTVPVIVTTDTGSSPPFSVELQRYSPGFFTFDSAGGPYVSATHLDGTYLGPAGLFGSTVTTQPARPGEMVVLYGTGFGPTDPPVPSDQIFSGAASLTDSLTITIGGVAADVTFAGMTGNGLYQFNVTVPPLATGDQEVLAVVGGVQTPASVYMTVQSD